MSTFQKRRIRLVVEIDKATWDEWREWCPDGDLAEVVESALWCESSFNKPHERPSPEESRRLALKLAQKFTDYANGGAP